jgi:DNA-formamidopyrimidine glycosylase
MPEISEVRISRDILEEGLKNRTLSEVNILTGKYTKKSPDNYAKLVANLPSKIKKVEAHGKFVYFTLENDWTIGISFGMSGRIMDGDDTPDHKHHRIEFLAEDGHRVFYNDMRNFGTMYFWPPDSDDLEKKLKTLGPDLLKSPDLSKEEVAKLFRVKKYQNKEITQVIMSQEVLAGPGNYMKSEALYDAKISPYAKVCNLTDANLYQLYRSLVKQAQDAYQFHKQNLTDYLPYKIIEIIWKVYMQETDPEGNIVLRVNDTKDKRTTHYVKEVQTKGLPTPKKIQLKTQSKTK